MPLFFRKKKSPPPASNADKANAVDNISDSTNESNTQAVIEPTETSTTVAQHVAEHDSSEQSPPEQNTLEQHSLEQQENLSQGLAKSSRSLLGGLSSLFSSGVTFDEELYEELEDTLISCDIGVDASQAIIESLRKTVKQEKLKTEQEVIQCLQAETTQLLSAAQKPWQFNLRPYVILMVGVNGVGKTTTTAKIANHFQQMGKKVILAAGDTFRAAAIEQLEEWGQRLDIQVVSQAHGADAAAVAHDAFSAALARDADVLIIDTAGRLHTQSDLMDQLEKVKRVLQKIDADTPHEVMQVLDATTGQNALSQLQHFQEAVGVNSVCLTKLDGSAKGGIALGLTQKFGLPIRFIGVGEAFEDLQAFDAQAFAQALIPNQRNNTQA